MKNDRCENRKSANPPRHIGAASQRGGARGFSLVELMVALTLGAFLIGAVITAFVAARTTATETETLSRAQENVRFASDYLIRDIRNAGFRDEASLAFAQTGELGQDGYFAAIENEKLVVRYFGRGNCGGQFTGSGLRGVENHYSVVGGNLVCQGGDFGGGNGPENLASGISKVEFEFLNTGGEPDSSIEKCAFPPIDSDPECTGVRIRLYFEGLDRAVELNAAFRNVILGRIYGWL